jgi:hypothetical protein
MTSIAWKGELEFCGATESDNGGRTVRFRLMRDPADMGLANPFAKFTRKRGKRAGTIFQGAITRVKDASIAYSDEVMLAGWADGPQGSTVTFWLSQEEARHPFLGCTRASSQSPGDRFTAAFVELADDGTAIDQEAQERHVQAAQTGKYQHRSNVAALFIKNPRFHDWLREIAENIDWTEDLADKWLKKVLKIDSKADLDDPKNEDAIALFVRMKNRFVAWQQDQGDNPERPF